MQTDQQTARTDFDYDAAERAVTRGFYQLEPFADALKLAASIGRPMIVFGDGGHAKSDAVTAFAEALMQGRKDQIMVKSLHQETTVSDLFGGIDIPALQNGEGERYVLDRSWAAYPVVIFEEVLDAPPTTLCALKDAITSRQIRNGSQVYDLPPHQVIIGITNKNPGDLSELGPEVSALVERWLDYKMVWHDYTADHFANMLERVRDYAPASLRHHLAQLAEQVHMEGNFISPRVVVNAVDMVMHRAKMRGRPGSPTAEDQDVLKFIREFQHLDFKEVKLREVAQAHIMQMRTFHKEMANLHDEDSMINLLRTAKEMHIRISEFEDVAVPDDMYDAHNTQLNALRSLRDMIEKKGLSLVR
jgi:hypothetical protein